MAVVVGDYDSLTKLTFGNDLYTGRIGKNVYLLINRHAPVRFSMGRYCNVLKIKCLTLRREKRREII